MMHSRERAGFQNEEENPQIVTMAEFLEQYGIFKMRCYR